MTGSPVMTFVSDPASDHRGSQLPARVSARIESATSRDTSGASSSSSWFWVRKVSHSERFPIGVWSVATRTLPSMPG